MPPGPDERIEIVAYDPGWPARFAQERSALDAVIGRWAIGGIHHVGSTAVAGLDAKPIIDILIGVESLEAARSCFDPLSSLCYLYAPYRAEVIYPRKNGVGILESGGLGCVV